MAPTSPDLLLAFAAGLLSVLSPCVLPLLPAYLSLVSGISVEEMQEGAQAGAGNPGTTVRGPVMRACVGFVLGFSTVFILLGVGAVAAGHLVRTWRAEVLGFDFGVTQIAGVLIVLLGLHMTGLSPIRALYRDTRFHFKMNRRSFLSTFLVGAGFALGWSPCIGPILATILTVAGQRETMVEGVGLLSVYSAGLAVPFLLAGWSMGAFFRTFQHVRRHFRTLEVASGLVLVGVGFLLVTDQFSSFNSRFSFMGDFINAAEKALQ
jgi:cytochrome c-type biogenesis protein